MRQIPVGDGSVALVDDEDYPLLARHTWHASVLGGHVYATRNVTKNPRATEAMHRLVLGPAPDRWHVADHINGDTLDNRKSNLRWVSKRGNALNSKRHRDGSVIGIDRVQATGKWRARIHDFGKSQHLGNFDSIEEAINARRFAEQKRKQT